MIQAAVRMAAGETVTLGDHLGHSRGGARTQRDPLAPVMAFAKVIGPPPCDRAPEGLLSRQMRVDHFSPIPEGRQ